MRVWTFGIGTLEAESGGGMIHTTKSEVTRRTFIRRSTAATPLAGLPTGYFGSAYASDAIEIDDLKIGIIAAADCSSIVVAYEKGIFKKCATSSVVSSGASRATIRDSLGNGDIQSTRMLLGIPIASSMGPDGPPKKPMMLPWLLNRNGEFHRNRGRPHARMSALKECEHRMRLLALLHR